MNKLKRILLLSFFVSLLYFPDNILDKVPFVVSIFLGILYLSYHKLNRVRTKFFNIFIIYSILIVYTLVLIVMRQNYNFYYVIWYIRIIILSCGIYFVLVLTGIKLYNILRILNVCLFLNLLASYIQYFDIGGLRKFTFSLSNSIEAYRYVGFRAMGLMSGYDLNGIVISINIVILLVIIKHCPSRLLKYFYYVNISLACFALLFSSRTGIISAVLLIILINVLNRINIFLRVAKHFYKYIIISTLVYFIAKLVAKKYYELINQSIQFMFEAFINYQINRRFETYSSNDLFTNHYFLPKGFINTIFGDGLHNAIRGSDRSDVAYIQAIFSFGVLGLVILILVYLIFIVLNLRIKKWILDNGFLNEKRLLIDLIHCNVSILTVLFIISFKGPYFFSITIMNILSLLVLCVVLEYKRAKLLFNKE